MARARAAALHAIAERERRARAAEAAAAAPAEPTPREMTAAERARASVLDAINGKKTRAEANQKPVHQQQGRASRSGSQSGARGFTTVLALSHSSSYQPPSRQLVTPGTVVNPELDGIFSSVLTLPDALALICTAAGLRAFRSIALVCRAWRAAVNAKAREWGVLTYLRAIGSGFGKRRAQLDTPTWLAWLPEREERAADERPDVLKQTASLLCVVDSCNYRLSAMRHDGTVTRLLARAGVPEGEAELSSPSSVCYDSARGCLYVMATVGAVDRRLLRFTLPDFVLAASSDEGLGASETDASEGMTCYEGVVYVVDTARHRLAAFDADTLQLLYFSGTKGRAQHLRTLNGEPIFSNPHDVVAHKGELYISDTHHDRIQVTTASRVRPKWVGSIGQRGSEPGQFIYPRGLAIARDLLYVCEAQQVQALACIIHACII